MTVFDQATSILEKAQNDFSTISSGEKQKNGL
jgi:hypothetical protein